MKHLASITDVDGDPITDAIVIGLICSAAGLGVVDSIDAAEGVWIIEEQTPITPDEGWLIVNNNAYTCVGVANDIFEINISMHETIT